MPVQTYETLFLLDAPKVTADADAVKTTLHHLLERHGAQITVSRPWDYNHKLAYPIRKQKKGAFHIIYYTLESTKQAELERDFALAEVVLRQMTSRLDPKWLDTIMQIAKEEAGHGFALRGMQDEASVTTDPAAIGMEPGEGMDHGGRGDRGDRGEGGGHRRGPRREMADKPE